MNVFFGCEYSGIGREAFRARGHSTNSCDLLPAADGSPHHWQGDIFTYLTPPYCEKLDLAIFHPPCTYLCSSGLHWNGRVEGRDELTEEALRLVCRILNLKIKCKAVENPVGCIGTRIARRNGVYYIVPKGFKIPKRERIPFCIVQPYNHGEDASKATVLYLDGVLPLRDTKYFPPRIVEWPPASGKMVERWSNQTDSGQNNLPPSEDRWADRSKSYPGIMSAMAAQWG